MPSPGFFSGAAKRNSMNQSIRKLPKYKTPPLNEVAVGVQFPTPKEYSQVLIGNIRSLYISEFPKITEMQPLENAFEFFGGPPIPPAGQGFRFLSEPLHSRYWFISDDESELIQFQKDRLMHNWRVQEDLEQTYPHFEAIANKFYNEMVVLDKYFTTNFNEGLNIQQYEISYINRIKYDISVGADPAAWLKIINLEGFKAEFSQCQFSEVILHSDGDPYARFNIDLKTMLSPHNEPHIVFSLTVRGIPKHPTISACVESLYDARMQLSDRFDRITTDRAKEIWGKYDG